MLRTVSTSFALRTAVLLLSSALAAQEPASPAPSDAAANGSGANPAAAVEHLINEASVTAPIEFLSHDLLEGRGVGARGDALARLYLRTQLELFGLEPGAPGGQWEQPVPIVGITSQVVQPLKVVGPNGDEAAFTAPQDYTAAAGQPAATTAWRDAEVVFVGYGITAPEQQWDDFGDADVRGKVLLVMNDDPDWDPELFAGKTRLYYGRWSYKYEEAARRGAIGAIVIHTTPSAGYPFQVIQATHGKEAFWLPFRDGEPRLQIRSWCSEEAARKITALGGHDLDALREKARQRGFRPVPLGVKVTLETQNTVRDIQSANVIGKLPGRDAELGREAVIATAHFDHLGIGTPKKGDGIWNGAVDNASGCSLMLNLARACGALQGEQRPRRTLYFAFVTAEESGLLGSQFLTQNLPLPREDVIANLNVDSVNVIGRTTDVEMIGYGKNSLTELAQRIARRRGREVKPDQQPDLGLFYRSDHFNFARIGVPAAYLKPGRDFVENPEGRRRVQAMFTTTKYHQPSDEYDARWDVRGTVEDARLMLELLLQVASTDEAPRWTPGDEFEKLR